VPRERFMTNLHLLSGMNLKVRKRKKIINNDKEKRRITVKKLQTDTQVRGQY